MCLTLKSKTCKNNTKGLFCRVHSTTCRRINKTETVCNEAKMLVPIKKTSQADVWFCCFNKTIAVYKEHKVPSEECKLLRQLNSKNIVSLLSSGSNYIILECYQGDLSNIGDVSDKVLESSHSQMINALRFIQEKSIIHTDIHQKNIFWTRTTAPKIDGISTRGFRFVLGDFGGSKSYPLGNNYGKRIHFEGNQLAFLDNREYVLTNKKKITDTRVKYVTDINELTTSFPTEYHDDLLALKYCYVNYKKFSITEYYGVFIKNFIAVQFTKPFNIDRKELFLADEMMKLIKLFTIRRS
jgi:serine/threonine protein kinase